MTHFWEYRFGAHWSPFDCQNGDEVEASYQQDKAGILKFSGMRSGSLWSYTIDLSKMTQTNDDTGVVREIRRSVISSPKWFFLRHGWEEFTLPEGDSAAVEALYQNAMTTKTPITTLVLPRFKLTIDFESFNQTADSYCYVNIQRVPTAMPVFAPINDDPIELQNKIDEFSKTGGVRPATDLTPELSTLFDIELKKLPQQRGRFLPFVIQTPPIELFPTPETFFDSANMLNENHYNAWRLAYYYNSTAQFNPYGNFDNGIPEHLIDIVNNDGVSPTDDNLDQHDEDIICLICHSELWDKQSHPKFPTDTIVQLPCSHLFHKDCLQGALQSSTKSGLCAGCRVPFLAVPGKQASGSATFFYCSTPCAGFSGLGTIGVDFNMESGTIIQNDGTSVKYHGDVRVAYFPMTSYVLRVLLPLYTKAWLLRKLFSVGYSETRRRPNVIIYSNIHIKTEMTGGGHGFPDDNWESASTKELITSGLYLTQLEIDSP